MNEAVAKQEPQSNEDLNVYDMHAHMVSTMAKPGADIIATLTVEKAQELRGAILKVTEAAQILDLVKKRVIYNKDVPGIPRDLSTPGNDFLATITPEQAHLLHMAVGIATEAGELLEAVARHVLEGDPLDTKNCVEELGDLEFYIEGERQGLELTRAATLDGNIDKLWKGDKARYKSGQYSDEQAQARADKPAGE